MKTPGWPLDRWCRYLEKRTGHHIDRTKAGKYYRAGISCALLLSRPLALASIIAIEPDF